MNIPFFKKNKPTRFALTLANDQTIFSNILEYSDKGVFIGRTLNGYIFVPYDAILRIDCNENYIK